MSTSAVVSEELKASLTLYVDNSRHSKLALELMDKAGLQFDARDASLGSYGELPAVETRLGTYEGFNDLLRYIIPESVWKGKSDEEKVTVMWRTPWKLC